MIVLLFSEFLFSDMIFSGSGDSQSLAGLLAALRLRNQALSFHPATTVKNNKPCQERLALEQLSTY